MIALPPPVEKREQASLMARLGRTHAAVSPSDLIYEASRWGKAAVGNSDDLTRILALPRREIPTDEQQDYYAQQMTEFLRYENPRCICKSLGRPCITKLNRIQGWYLWEAAQTNGALGHVVVGGGKCLAHGSEFFDALAGRRRDISECPTSAIVSALVPGRLGLAPAAGMASGSKTCWRVTLCDGKHLDASFDHPILTSRGWIQAQGLAPGDFVAVPTHAPEPVVPTQATDDEVGLMALLLSDGGLSGVTARFTNATPAVIEKFKYLASAVCAGFSEQKSRSKAREFSVLGATPWRKRWGLYGLAKNKRAPAELWGLPDDQIALFLNYFWACDGYINKGKGLEVVLASEKLVDDIIFFLLRLGIRGRKRYKKTSCNGKKFDSWRVSVTGQDALNFLDEMGNVLGKESGCEELRVCLAGKRRNANRDVVPVGWAEASEIYDEMGWLRGKKGEPKGNGMRGRARKFLQPTPGQYISRSVFAAFCKRFDYKGKYSRLIQDGIAWEQVKSLELKGELPVFDLSVSGVHNFVCNGMVIHNTGIDILLAMAVDGAKRAVLLIPPNLRKQFAADFVAWSQHFRTPNLAGSSASYYPDRPVLHVLAYSELSHAKAATWFAANKPDIIIADEAQNLKDRQATRTSRFIRYFTEGDGNHVRFFCHSGSLTTRSLNDYAHLSALALGNNSPLPIDPGAVNQWCSALDPVPAGGYSAPLGALRRLCDVGETGRSGFRRRLLATAGVVATQDAQLPIGLKLRTRSVQVPAAVSSLLESVRSRECRPDGEELVEAVEVAACCRQLASGIYLRWRYPHGEPEELIAKWFSKRQQWNRELREKLKYRTDHLDSPKLCTDAARRHFANYVGPLPRWEAETWLPWESIEDQVRPVPDVVWVDDFLAKDAARWAKENTGIVWTLNPAFANKVASLAGVPYYGAGLEASGTILTEKGNRSIVASIQAHGAGKNLQMFNRALVAQPPSNGGDWEQLIGRMHRQGQQADTVTIDVYGHTEEVRDALEKSIKHAEYVLATVGAAHKLLTAERG